MDEGKGKLGCLMHHFHCLAVILLKTTNKKQTIKRVLKPFKIIPMEKYINTTLIGEIGSKYFTLADS